MEVEGPYEANSQSQITLNDSSKRDSRHDDSIDEISSQEKIEEEEPEED